MENNTNIKRDYVIDNVKLICLFLILFFHIPSIIGHLHAAIYLFHVPVFFLISGIFFKERTFSETLKTSARSLLLPYLVFNLIIVAISCVISIAGNYGFTLQKNIIQPLLGIVLGSSGFDVPLRIPGEPSWFLIALFVDRLIFNIILHVQIYLKLIISIALVVAFLVLSNITDWYAYSIGGALLGLPFMAFGYLVKDKVSTITKIPIAAKFALIIVLAASLYVISAINGTSNMFAGKYGNTFVLFLAGGIAGSLLIYLICTLLNTSNKVTRLFIEGSTFFICMHIMVMNYVILIYRRSLGFTDALMITDKIIISIITVGIIYVMIRAIKRFTPRLLKL